MRTTPPHFIGIDIGTQGARVILIDSAGNIAGSEEQSFTLTDRSREEQSPLEWWDTTWRLLKTLTTTLKNTIDLTAVKAIAVTSTSGTVIPLDAQHHPLHDAILYSDQRSAEEGRLCRDLALRYHPEGYTGYNSSSGLSKMVWYTNHFAPDAAHWIHAADYITGRLSGAWDITDYTNALKSGFDVEKKEWPAWLTEHLPIKSSSLPAVLPSGTPLGTLDTELATQLHLTSDVQVVVGITDGCASQIASGAVSVGDWNTTIGTTMVIKGVTKEQIKDPLDRIYSHRHPEGFWMPGGASNTGADWVTKEFHNDLPALNQQAAALIPTGYIAWPLRQNGERFPFISPQARGFTPAAAPNSLSKAQLYTANMEGVAYLERYAYELIKKLSHQPVTAVYTAGGASNSDAWLTIRANVLDLPIYKMRHVSAAVGAAILAASRTHFSSLTEAARAMTQTEKEIRPTPGLSARYNKLYQQFLITLHQKGYIREEEYA